MSDKNLKRLSNGLANLKHEIHVLSLEQVNMLIEIERLRAATGTSEPEFDRRITAMRDRLTKQLDRLKSMRVEVE